MALVCRSEISALTRLLRGLCIKKQSCDVASARQLSVAASCTHQKKLSSSVVTRATTNAPMPMPSLCLSLTPGVYLPQCRYYAKAAPPQRKKLSFDYSGDLATQKPLDPQATHIDFRDCALPESASESIEKLCSIDFASGSEKKLHRKEEMKERILQLFGEEADREMHVAMLTVDIRNMIPHVLTDRKDKLSKSRLVEKIQLRKKMLKKLRREDYQRFLWLLQTLRIRYVLPPDYHKHITKKYRRKQRVWEAASAQRQAKLSALKEQLRGEKEEFLQHKAEVLNKLALDAERHGLDLKDFQGQLERKREGRTYPTILTWEQRLLLPDGHPLKPELSS